MEHIIRCESSAYQQALSSLVGRAVTEGGLKGISINNSVLELRKICNHPLISKLHVQVLSS